MEEEVEAYRDVATCVAEWCVPDSRGGVPPASDARIERRSRKVAAVEESNSDEEIPVENTAMATRIERRSRKVATAPQDQPRG